MNYGTVVLISKYGVNYSYITEDIKIVHSNFGIYIKMKRKNCGNFNILPDMEFNEFQ